MAVRAKNAELQTIVGNLTGTATKAIKDGNDNVIAKYIKELSISEKTITFTRGDGTEGTIDTQDTTYPPATKTSPGLMTAAMVTKLDGITDSADAVSFTRSLTTGTKIGTITINGTNTDLYCQTNVNTHYTTHLYAGTASGAANAETTNGNTNLIVTDDSTVRNRVVIKGEGATTVTSNSEGVITVRSDNTTYTAGAGLSLSGNQFKHSNSITAGTASGSASASPLTFGGTFTIPSITYDAQGHITGKSTTTVTMPANPNTDSKVYQTESTTSNFRPIILGYKDSTSSSGLAAAVTNQVYATTKMYAQPSSGTIFATSYKVAEKVALQYDSNDECLNFVFG